MTRKRQRPLWPLGMPFFWGAQGQIGGQRRPWPSWPPWNSCPAKDTNGDIHTSIFRKSSDRNTILRADSFHPSSLINNIPFGQFQRLRRICDSDNDFELQATDMHQRFSQRGYRRKNLNQAYNKAKSLERRNLFEKSPRQTKSGQIFFSTQYSTHAYDIKRIIQKNWSILQSDPDLRPVFSDSPSFSFRRAPTLKDKLVRSYLPASPKETWLQPPPEGNFRCGHCNHCSNMIKSNSFVDIFTQKTYLVRSFANCNSTYVVYRLQCECGCFYIGRTKRRLRDRFAEHKNAVRIGNPNYPMAEHYKTAGHSNPNNLKVMVIEVIPKSARGGDRLKQLLQRETFWIVTLKATTFPGLNDEVDFSPFLKQQAVQYRTALTLLYRLLLFNIYHYDSSFKSFALILLPLSIMALFFNPDIF